MSNMYSERVIVSILQNWNLCLYQVSKSWKSLAEDELLWCKICHELGYEEDTLAVERIDWKEIVRQSVSHKKLVLSNWKVKWRCRSLNLKLILIQPYLWYIDFLVDDSWMIIKLIIFLLLQERKGEVRQLQHMPGGILCSVHSFCNFVAAG